MIESLVDHPQWMYIALGVVALALLIGLWATRKRGYAIGLGVVAVLAFLFWLFTYLTPTDQKQITGAIADMGQGVRNRDANRIFANISDQFRLGGFGKDSFRQMVETVLRRGGVAEVVVYGMEDAQVSRP